MALHLIARRDFVGALITATAGLQLAVQAHGQSAAHTPPPIQATRLADHLIVFSGDGGNMALVTNGDASGAPGLVLIDTGYLERADDLLHAIAAQDPGAVHTVFNTHWHVDHVGANPALGRAGAAIVAQENVKARLSQTVTVEAMNNRVFAPLPPEGLPTQVFKTGGKLASGAGPVEYTHVPTAHTDGDSYLFFPELNLLHTGDLFWNGLYPLIDYSTQGWIGGMAASNAQMLKLCDAATRIIPGHGPIAAKADLERSHLMLATLHDRLEKMVKQGQTARGNVRVASGRSENAGRGAGLPTRSRPVAGEKCPAPEPDRPSSGSGDEGEPTPGVPEALAPRGGSNGRRGGVAPESLRRAAADEAVAAAPTRDFDAAWTHGMKPDAFVRMAYTGILRRKA